MYKQKCETKHTNKTYFVQVHNTNILRKITSNEKWNIYFTYHADSMGFFVSLQDFPIVTDKQTNFQSTVTKHYRVMAVDGPTVYICKISEAYNSVMSVIVNFTYN